jgi:hypothetical protein
VLRGLFIPVVAGRAVSTTRASGPPRRLGSAREIELRAGGARSTSERLRETNTLTARTYRRHAADSHFLFFPQPVWLRPIAGLANLGYGLAHASLGLLTAPFDRGERLRRGAMGAVMSVPELFFFRVRQGSYPATPPDLLARPDRTHEESGEGSSADGRSRVEVADPMLSSGLAAPQSAGFAAVPPSASAGSSSTR